MQLSGAIKKLKTESTFEKRENTYFTSKTHFVLEILNILDFYDLNCHCVIKYLNMKQEIHFTE